MKLIKEYVDYENLDVISEDYNGKKSFKIKGPFIAAEKVNKNGRIYPIHLLEREVKKYNIEKIQTKRAMGELDHPSCNLSIDFDVLTSNGWKPFKKLDIGEEILTLDTNGQIQIKPIQKIINEPYKGHAYKLKGRNIDSSFTPTHRFLLENRRGIQEYVTIEDIYNNRKKYSHHNILKLGNWYGEDKEYFVFKGKDGSLFNKSQMRTFNEDITKDLIIPTDIFVKFLGFWLADGYVSKTKKYKFGLCQNDNIVSEKIDQLLEEFPIKHKKYTKKNASGNIKYGYEFSDIRLYEYLLKLGNCYDKYIPQEVKNLPKKYLKDLVYWFALGDGRFIGEKEEDKILNVFSVSKKLIEDLHECLIKSGGSGNWTEHNSKEDYMFAEHLIEIKNKKTLYQLSVSSTRTISLDYRMLSIEKIEHDDNVYCLTVENSNFYMKENGKCFWTGNSPHINLDRVSHLIESLEMVGNDGMGVAKILDTPTGRIASTLLEQGIKLGVSSRGVGSLNGNKVDDSYILCAIDIVCDPSAPNAIVDSVYESAEYIMDGNRIVEVAINKMKSTLDKKGSRDIYNTLNEFLNEIRKG